MTETLKQSNEPHLIQKKYLDNTSHLSTQPNSLNELIELLHQAFATNEVNIDYVYTIMNNYKGTIKEWAPFVKFQPDRYTRNLVDAGNGKFNLMILCWAESQGSSIHNHTNSHCFMKCLQGTLIETRYAWPTINQEEPMHIISRGELKEGQVAYINDSMGLHRVENPSHTETAITLHIYIPPYDHCNTFDERTSRIKEAHVTFYSICGQLATNQ
jgi:cysteine dioxygenase